MGPNEECRKNGKAVSALKQTNKKKQNQTKPKSINMKDCLRKDIWSEGKFLYDTKHKHLQTYPSLK